MLEIKIDPDKIKRTKVVTDKKPEKKDPDITQGTIPQLIDLAFNPSRDKIREVTIVDRIQGRFFPLIDMINYMRHHVLEIALYRQNPEEYELLYEKPCPVQAEPLDEFIYRTAQWQKSVQGKNLEKASDIALAETEIKGQEVPDIGTSGFDEK